MDTDPRPNRKACCSWFPNRWDGLVKGSAAFQPPLPLFLSSLAHFRGCWGRTQVVKGNTQKEENFLALLILSLPLLSPAPTAAVRSITSPTPAPSHPGQAGLPNSTDVPEKGDTESCHPPLTPSLLLSFTQFIMRLETLSEALQSILGRKSHSARSLVPLGPRMTKARGRSRGTQRWSPTSGVEIQGRLPGRGYL